MLNLTGRVIMISGANRGIGLAVARRLLDGGTEVGQKLLENNQILTGHYLQT